MLTYISILSRCIVFNLISLIALKLQIAVILQAAILKSFNFEIKPNNTKKTKVPYRFADILQAFQCNVDV